MKLRICALASVVGVLAVQACAASDSGAGNDVLDGGGVADLGIARDVGTLADASENQDADSGAFGDVQDTFGRDGASDAGPTKVLSPCLTATVVVTSTGVPEGQRLRIENPDIATYDLRGVTVRAEPTGPLIDFWRPTTFCVTGASAIAKYPPGFVVNWRNVKVGDGTYGPYDEGGFHTYRPQTGTTVFDHVYVEGTEDGLMLARHGIDTTQKWELRDSYLKDIIDDAIENDGFRSGKILDVLSEGTDMFYSARGSVELPHALEIADTVIGFACKPDDRDIVAEGFYQGPGRCPDGTGVNYVFKITQSQPPQIQMRNTIIHHPAVPRSGGLRAACLPEAGQYSNVTIVWTAAVNYPCATLPGVRVTNDLSVYTNARDAWFARHGCRPDGTDCAFLRR